MRRRRPRTVRGLQPRRFPEEQTASLTASVGAAVAPNPQMNRILDRTVPPGIDGVAGLMSRSGHLETLSSKFQHLRHERHVADRTLVIQRLQNPLRAKYFHPVTDVVLHVAP